MTAPSAEERARLERRLARIEGQVRGIRRMLDEERDCREVVQQVAAVRAAVHQVGLELLRAYASRCLVDASGEGADEDALDYVISTLGRWA